ncbi:MAG: hypothetical protein COT17_04370 [Elusimicrobia bacterium CG08_land_8_20_14_0_20_51_18]|nr:MAG: hypothetical protein COT17_04370 [Elusimicrobia bacterium CG08_land_8_20_14_0_20_51_18]
MSDKKRDGILKKGGWTVLRLGEKEIMEDMKLCLDKIRKNAEKLGGQ